MSSVRRQVLGRRPLALALVLSALSIVLLPAAARADGVLDQSQPMFVGSAAGTCAGERLAQTFTSGLSGGLDRVDLNLWRDESNLDVDLQVQIQTATSGIPSGTVLASGYVPLRLDRHAVDDPRLRDGLVRPSREGLRGQPIRHRGARQPVGLHRGLLVELRGRARVSRRRRPLGHGGRIPFGGDHGVDFAFKTFVDTTFPSVDISHGDTRLRPDGTVPLSVFVRCQPGQQAFELDVSVHQGTGLRLGDAPRTRPHRLRRDVAPGPRPRLPRRQSVRCRPGRCRGLPRRIRSR